MINEAFRVRSSTPTISQEVDFYTCGQEGGRTWFLNSGNILDRLGCTPSEAQGVRECAAPDATAGQRRSRNLERLVRLGVSTWLGGAGAAFGTSTILIPIQEDLLSRVSAVPMPTSELESNSLHRPLANDANLCSSSCHYSLHSVSSTVGEMAESTTVEMR
ncbi:hypothetical protein B296_00016875 [Ensete ventricosum]|uniref:Uncharacterized protein n=1 Tax=Ensete ventricosum TaxID=4639 RepID=A0A427B5I0_ENSVE|nr:hypothetical protein B296_00016875 [Ensete ventricosum]